MNISAVQNRKRENFTNIDSMMKIIAGVVMTSAILLIVNMMYGKIPEKIDNREVALRISEIMTGYTAANVAIILERVRMILIIILIVVSKRRRLLFGMFVVYEVIMHEILMILLYYSSGISGILKAVMGAYPELIMYLTAILIVRRTFINKNDEHIVKSKKIRKKRSVNMILAFILTCMGIVLEVMTKK